MRLINRTIKLLSALILFFISCSDHQPLEPDYKQSYPYNQVSLSLNRVNWKKSAKPINIEATYTNGNIYYHAPMHLVPVDEVYDREVLPGEAALRTFRLIFQPNDNSLSWAGITTHFSETILEKTEFFEFRAKGSHGKLHFDFGYVNEDIDGDNFMDTEDLNHNGSVDETEDTGLDGLPDKLEPGYDPILNPDPNRDNWFFRGEGKCPLPHQSCETVDWDDENIYYLYLNGTEGDRSDLANFGMPSSEIFKNRTFNLINSYFSYTVNLENTDCRIDSTYKNDWYTYRLPLRNLKECFVFTDNNMLPSWKRLNNIRIWFESEPGQTVSDTIEFAHMFFMQNRNELPDQNNNIIIREYNYEERRIFDLGLPGEFANGDSIISLQMYQSSDIQAPYSVLANMYVDPDNPNIYPEDRESNGNLAVIEIPPTEYIYFNYYQDSPPYLIFDQMRNADQYIGYFAIVKRNNGTIDTLGNLNNSVYDLKLLVTNVENADPAYASWNQMWRNCYKIPLDADYSKIKVKKGLEHSDNYSEFQVNDSTAVSYLEILGLDQYDDDNHKIPDGVFDYRDEIIHSDLNLIIFPNRYPFNSDTTFAHDNGSGSPPLNDKLPNIYHYNSLFEKQQNSKYVIEISPDVLK